jgi:hypothetical protein
MLELDVVTNECLVRINIDSSSSSHEGWRISMYPYLLDTSELPSEIETYKKIKVAYFTNNSFDKDSLSYIVVLSEKNGFYQKKTITGLLSNYPEWVVLRKKGKKRYSIIKDQWYVPLSDIIETLDDSAR